MMPWAEKPADFLAGTAGAARSDVSENAALYAKAGEKSRRKGVNAWPKPESLWICHGFA